MDDKDYMATRLFTDRDTAEREYNAFVARGYDAKDINVIMTEEGRKRHFSDGTTTELGNKALEGAGVGGGIGAVAGGTLAAIPAAATVAVPGVGLLLARPIAARLAGGRAGAVGGGSGALVGAGIPEERIKEYESGLKEGGILMGVKPRNAEERAYLEQDWSTSDHTATPAGRRGL